MGFRRATRIVHHAIGCIRHGIKGIVHEAWKALESPTHHCHSLQLEHIVMGLFFGDEKNIKNQ